MAVTFLVVLALALIVFFLFRAWGARSRERGIHRVLLRVTYPILVLLITLIAALLPRPWGMGRELAESDWVFAWTVFWIAIFAIRLLEGLVFFIHGRRSKDPFPVSFLLRSFILWLFYLSTAFVILKYILGVDITPLLATSAVLTMVVGLALQGVLGNLLAGVSLNFVHTVEVGNLIRVGDQEGLVVHTNWRETIIRTRDDDYVHIPNSVLASERIVNYSKPKQLHRHHIDVGASYSDAPADVIEALEEAARESSTALDNPAPVAHLTGYLDFGINYRLFFWSKNLWRKSLIEGEVGRLIWYKFKRRGIEIPFPMSDELLNDFMAVVYNQRRIPPAEEDVENMVRILRSSRFLTKSAEEKDALPEPLLSDEAIRELARSCRTVRFTKGEILFRQGESGEVCYIVVKGKVDGDIEYHENGATHHFTFETDPGHLIGEMSLFTGMSRTATARFKMEAELLEIPKDAFATLLARHDEIADEIAAIVASRNEQNRAFLGKIESLSHEELDRSCDQKSVRSRLKNLAVWGRGLLSRQ